MSGVVGFWFYHNGKNWVIEHEGRVVKAAKTYDQLVDEWNEDILTVLHETDEEAQEDETAAGRQKEEDGGVRTN